MNIQTLRYFIALAEQRTTLQVAEQFFITQPALSRSIQRLEDELGCKLFDRRASSLRLTKPGETILPLAQQIVSLSDDISSVIQDFNYGYHSSLSIGCCGCETNTFYNLIRDIHQHYPRINIRTPKFFSVADMINSVLSREIDLCFAYTQYSYGGKPLSYIFTEPIHLQLIVFSMHPFANQKKIPIQLLDGQKLLFWRRDMLPSFHDFFSQLCLRFNIHPHIVGQFTSKQELFSRVAADEGIAVVHSSDIYMPEKGKFSFAELVTPEGELLCQGGLGLFWNQQNNNPTLPHVLSLARSKFPISDQAGQD